ncbi:MAG: single-stranded DNA-binding protein [Cytophagaceae bacterium]|nr:single-stranded DNA-binding protein [Cytophagaceae bacterium]
MARSVNKVILIGNLGNDPEVRSLPSGMKVVNFNIATSEQYTNKNGEQVTQTEWHRIEMWDKMADIAERYLKKGNPVYIEGRIRTEEWTDKEGHSRTTVKIRAQEMSLLGGRPGDENVSASAGSSASSASASSGDGQRRAAPQPAAATASSEPAVDDDLPF